MQNAQIESLNSQIRKRLLHAHWVREPMEVRNKPKTSVRSTTRSGSTDPWIKNEVYTADAWIRSVPRHAPGMNSRPLVSRSDLQIDFFED